MLSVKNCLKMEQKHPYLLRTECLIWGYLRSRIKSKLNKHTIIPKDIQTIILDYYFIKDKWNEKIVANNTKISNEIDGIKFILTKDGWSTVFGTIKISSGICEWKLKLNKGGGSARIGIIDSSLINSNQYNDMQYRYN